MYCRSDKSVVCQGHSKLWLSEHLTVNVVVQYSETENKSCLYGLIKYYVLGLLLKNINNVKYQDITSKRVILRDIFPHVFRQTSSYWY
jgi:hypothetical protein